MLNSSELTMIRKCNRSSRRPMLLTHLFKLRQWQIKESFFSNGKNLVSHAKEFRNLVLRDSSVQLVKEPDFPVCSIDTTWWTREVGGSVTTKTHMSPNVTTKFVNATGHTAHTDHGVSECVKGRKKIGTKWGSTDLNIWFERLTWTSVLWRLIRYWNSWMSFSYQLRVIHISIRNYQFLGTKSILYRKTQTA